MQKKLDHDFLHIPLWRKNLFLTARYFLVLWAYFGLSAFSVVEAQKISEFSVKDADLKSCIVKVEKISGIGFIYNGVELEKVHGITLSMRDVRIEQLLDRLLDGSGFTYEIQNGVVAITKQQPARAQQQPTQRTLTGRVTTPAGSPIVGVTVVLKGTAFGVATGEDGRYRLVIPNQEGVLQFSFLGKETKEIPLSNRNEINVVLEDKAADIEDIVVTGIYSRDKSSFTGSSSSYSAKELKMVGSQNVLQSLKTLDPSFAIIEDNQWGSDPNRLPDINVRGKTSVIGLTQEYSTDPNQPLFILDGFESTLATISDLSMDRVQSITVLKDAAATAIYGSKAANGVIVVETKAPEPGALRLNYNGNLQLSFSDLSDYNLMNAEEKLNFEKFAGYYGKLDASGEIVEEYHQQNYYKKLAEIRRGVNSYWLNEPLRLGVTNSHNIFAEGGDNRMRYGLGLSYQNTQGVMKGSDRNVINGNVRLTYRYKTLSFTNYLNLDYSLAERETVPFSAFSRSNPYYRKVNEDGIVDQLLNQVDVFDGDYSERAKTLYVSNPIYEMALNSFNKTRGFGFRNNFEVEWRVLDELRLRGRFSISNSTSRNEVFNSPKAHRFITLSADKGSYDETTSEALNYDGDFSATYGKLFNDKHMVNAVATMRISDNSNRSSGMSAIGFIDDRYPNPNFSKGYPEGGKPNYSKSQRRSASYFVNAGYSYANRYMLETNLRLDGSSIFGASKRFTTTWSVGLAWNVHNENFFKESSVISMLKFRFSIGNPGNQNFDAYMIANTYTYNTLYPNPFGLSALISAWGNNNLEWQQTLDKNFGVDMELFNRRLRAYLEVFTKDTDPLLHRVSLPTSTGTSSAPMNLGSQTTHGATFMLSGTILRTEQMNWSVNLNGRWLKYKYSNIGNLLDKYNQDNKEKKEILPSNLRRYYDGGSPSDLWAVRSAGIDPVTGREIFIKRDGSQTFEFSYDDEVVVGNSDPKLEGVIGTSFYYKGFSASINFRYRVGGQIFLKTLYDKVENINESDLQYNQDKRALYDRWQKSGDVAKFKSIVINDPTPMSSRFIANENTFSGESISVGYETQAPWLRKIGASSMTVRAYMNDIFRISTVKDERGLDYPFQRSVSISLGLRF